MYDEYLVNWQWDIDNIFTLYRDTGHSVDGMAYKTYQKSHQSIIYNIRKKRN